MRTRLAIFFVLWVVLVTALIATAAPPPVLPPIQRNFFTTNPAPVVDAVAGSNVTVQATTVGTDTRHFTVNATTDTNVVNILIAGVGGGIFVQAGTNIIAVTNGSVVTVHGVTDTNIIDLVFGLPATNQSLLIGANATNNDLVIGLGATNQSLLIGANGTNDVLRIGLAATNNDLAMGVLSTNFGLLIGQNATNNDLLFGANATNQSLLIGANGTNNVIAATNSLADTNWVLNQLASYGSYLYFGGPTNTFAITNSGESVSRTNVWTGSTAPFATAATSSVASLTLNAYVRHVMSTNTFSVIEAGPVSITTYPFKSGGGTPQIHYEFYAVDAVSNIMYELAAGPATQITATVPTIIQTSLTLTNSFIATNKCYFAIACKIDNVGAANTLYWAHGGGYDAHATFVRPLSSATINASQIVDAPWLTNNDSRTLNFTNVNVFGTLSVDNGSGSSTFSNVTIEGSATIQSNLTVKALIGTNWMAGTNYLGGTNSVGGPTNAVIVTSDRFQVRNIKNNGTNIWYIDPATGNVYWNTDGGSSIGADGASRPDYIFCKTSFESGGSMAMGATSSFLWKTRTRMAAPDQGGIRFYDYVSGTVDRFYIKGATRNLTDATATEVFSIISRTNYFVGGTIDYTIHAADANHRQILSGIVTYAAVNTNGIWQVKTCTENASNQALAATDGTLTAAWTMVDATSGGTTNVTIKCTADSSLTTSSLYIMWQARNNTPYGTLSVP